MLAWRRELGGAEEVTSHLQTTEELGILQLKRKRPGLHVSVGGGSMDRARKIEQDVYRPGDQQSKYIFQEQNCRELTKLRQQKRPTMAKINGEMYCLHGL